MNLESHPLEGRFVRLEPFAPDLKDAVRAAVDCDPDAWALMPVNAMGDGFENYWAAACGAPLDQRISYAFRRRSDGQIVGMSTLYTRAASQGCIEIGSTFLRPEVRGGVVNPEAKMLMLGHAFGAGAMRVQLRVDTRNRRSQAAVAKLGAVRETVLKGDGVTWTGHLRDTVMFAILDHQWPTVRARLEQRIMQ